MLLNVVVYSCVQHNGRDSTLPHRAMHTACSFKQRPVPPIHCAVVQVQCAQIKLAVEEFDVFTSSREQVLPILIWEERVATSENALSHCVC